MSDYIVLSAAERDAAKAALANLLGPPYVHPLSDMLAAVVGAINAERAQA